MTIPGSPGIPYDWEILAADCPTLAMFAKDIVKAANHYDAIVRNSDEDLGARAGALLALMVLRRKYGLVEGMWKVRSCKGELPGPMPVVAGEEQWPPTWPY